MPDLKCTGLFDLDTVILALAGQLSDQYHINLTVECNPKSACDVPERTKKTAP